MRDVPKRDTAGSRGGGAMADYAGLTDEELIARLRAGDQEVTDYLMEKYKYLVRRKAKAMYLIGGDNDDLIQEGMIGLFKAARDYDGEKEASFFSFADLCVSRQLYSAVQASRRQKHIPLNTYVSLYSDTRTGEGARIPLGDVLQSSQEMNPEELVIDRESAERIEAELDGCLSDFEQEVLNLYMLGHSYTQIAALLDRSPKSVDNALQRLKAKIRQILDKNS